MLLTLLTLSMPCVSADVPRVRVLCIGNSHTNRMVPHLNGFLNARPDVLTGISFFAGDGGAAISGLYDYIEESWIPKRGEFQYITMQQRTGFDTRAVDIVDDAFSEEFARGDSFIDIYTSNIDHPYFTNGVASSSKFVNTYNAYYSLIKEQSPGSPRVLQYGLFAYSFDQATSEKHHRGCEFAAALGNYKGVDSRVTPVGRAFQYVNENGVYVTGEDLQSGDVVHASSTGYFLAAALFFQTILDDRFPGFTLSDFPYLPEGMSLQQRNELIAVAKQFSTAPKSYATWIESAGVSVSDALPNSILHDDRLNNLLKYAFNLNVNKPDHRTLIPGTGTGGLPVLGVTNVDSERNISFEYVRRKGASVDYAPLQSSTLSDDSWVSATGTEMASDIDGEWERVTIDTPVNEAPGKLFYKINISEVTTPDPETVEFAINNSSSARIRDDAAINGQGNTLQYNQGLNVGTLSYGPGTHAAIAFQMNGATAAEVLGGDFSISYNSKSGTPNFNVDLYYSRVSATGELLASDYQAANLVMKDFITTSSTPGNHSLDGLGRENLSFYIKNQWEEGSYMILTLKTSPVASTLATASDFYSFGAAKSDGTSDNAQLHVKIPAPVIENE